MADRQSSPDNYYESFGARMEQKQTVEEHNRHYLLNNWTANDQSGRPTSDYRSVRDRSNSPSHKNGEADYQSSAAHMSAKD